MTVGPLQRQLCPESSAPPLDVAARASFPRRPAPPFNQPKTEVKQEEEDSGQPTRGASRPREDESPHSRSVRRMLRVQGEFEDVLPGYIPFMENAAGRIGCALVPRPLTPEQPIIGCAATQTTPTLPVTISSSTPMTPLPSPPSGSTAARPESPPPLRTRGRRIAVMSTMPRPRPLRTEQSAFTVLSGTTPTRPPPLAIRRSPLAALGPPPRDGNSSEEEGELPDLPEGPYSPADSDITIMRLVLVILVFLCIF